MTGDVDERKTRPACLEMRKPKLDRDPASFFFRQPVDRAAGERVHKGRLSMVNVSGQADNILRTLRGNGRRGARSFLCAGGLHYFMLAPGNHAVSHGQDWYK